MKTFSKTNHFLVKEIETKDQRKSCKYDEFEVLMHMKPAHEQCFIFIKTEELNHNNFICSHPSQTDARQTIPANERTQQRTNH